MNVHFIIDSIYSRLFISEVRKRFPTDDNIFYCLKNTQLKYLSSDEVTVINPYSFFSFIVKTFKIVNSKEISRLYLHYFSNYHTIVCLLCLKKIPIYWGYWGADLYNDINYQLYDNNTLVFLKEQNKTNFIRVIYLIFRKYVIEHKISYITMKLQNEFKLLHDFYKTKIKRIDFEYPNPIEHEGFIHENNNVPNVLVGNSGDPGNNHYSIFECLAKINFEFNAIVPLSYGNEEYITAMNEKGKFLLEKKFHPLLQFMSPDEYQELLNTIDICIMNHYRQQGLGNIRYLLQTGTKIFLNPINPLYNYLVDNGIKIYRISDLYEKEAFCPLEMKIKKENSRIIRELFSKQYYDKAFNELFRK